MGFCLCRDLELYSTKFTDAGRIVFEVAVDYDQVSHSWKEMLRIWVSAPPPPLPLR